MSNISIKGEEHVDWSIMGPIYKDQCEALLTLVDGLKEFIFKLGKEASALPFSPPEQSPLSPEEKESLLEQKYDDKYHDLKDNGFI
jgi:hypothetical protein